MALPAFAEIADLEARMGPVVDATRAQAALDDASSAIRDVAGKTWVDAEGALALPDDPSSTVADTLMRVCCAVARRILENPEGATAESVGSFSQSFGGSSNDVYLTSAERRAVRRAAGIAGLRAIPTARGQVSANGVFGGLETNRCGRPDVANTEYLPVTPEGAPIPFTGPEGY